jgi:hypothetical protein
MFAPGLIQGRWLGAEDFEALQRLIGEHPHWSRRRLSIALCEALNWRTASGQLKDMSATVFGPVSALQIISNVKSGKASQSPFTYSAVASRLETLANCRIAICSAFSEYRNDPIGISMNPSVEIALCNC